MNHPLSEFPEQAATERSAGGDRPFLLRGDRVWIVRTGRIDVFATALDGDEPEGARTHLFRVEEDGALMSVGQGARTGLLGVGSPGTTLVELDAGYLRSAAVYPDVQAPFVDLLHGWIGHLYQGLAAGRRRPRHRTVEAGESLEVEDGTAVRPASRVAWMELAGGDGRLLGSPSARLESGALLPVSDEAWVTADGGASFRALSTRELLAAGADGGRDVWASLEGFHRVAMDLVADRVGELERAARTRIRRQDERSRAALRSAVARLAFLMEPSSRRPLLTPRPADGERGDDDRLAAAFRLVAAAEGIELNGAAPRSAGRSAKEPVEALARAHRVRARRVALRSRWWMSDNGPIVARLAEGDGAVALLPEPGGGYSLVDPSDGTRAPVTEEVAVGLRPFGYMLYRPFPSRGLGAADLLRFGLEGCNRDVLTILGAGGAMAVLGLVTPLAIGALFNTIIPAADRSQLLQLTLVLGIVALAAAAFQLVRGFALLRMESKVGTRLQAAVWDRLLTLPLPFFRRFSAGDLAERAMGIEQIRKAISGVAVTVLLSGLFSLANFVLMLHYDRGLAGYAALLILLAVLTTLAIAHLHLERKREITRLRARTSGIVLQLLTGIAKLKIVGAEARGFGLWAKIFGDGREEQLRARTLGNLLTVFNGAYPVVSSMVVFALAAPQVTASPPDLATGDFLAFVAAFNLALAGTLSSGSALIDSLVVIPLYEQLAPILRTEPEVRTGSRDPGPLSGALELQHVTFRYQADGPAVLSDVSLRARPGEFVALVGPSGSGKSTVLRLLLGFETPDSGSVSYDHQDLAGLDIDAVRIQIGAVLQDGRLMGGDLFTNIVGSSDATLEDAWKAARMAGLAGDIREMPMGMHTVIDVGGGTLSGGQRQRLMIARALVHGPSILFFDEATSALDNRTQDIVSRSLDRLKVTRIVVAHRLSTIRGADRIYVLEEGRLAESGTYEELIERGGVFTDLANRQLL